MNDDRYADTLFDLSDEGLMKRLETVQQVPPGMHDYGARLVARKVWVADSEVSDDPIEVDAYSLADENPPATTLRKVGFQCFNDDGMVGGVSSRLIFLSERKAWTYLRRQREQVYQKARIDYERTVKTELALRDKEAFQS